MSEGEETKGLNLKKQWGKRKRRWGGGGRGEGGFQPLDRLFALFKQWTVCALNFPDVSRQPSKAGSIKGKSPATCCLGVSGTPPPRLARCCCSSRLVNSISYTHRAPRKSCSVYFSSQTHGFFFLPPFVSGRWAANNKELLPNDSCHSHLERQR